METGRWSKEVTMLIVMLRLLILTVNQNLFRECDIARHLSVNTSSIPWATTCCS